MSSLSASIESCLICGSKRLKPLPRYAAHHLVRCKECSFVFACRRPSREELNRIYSAYQRGASIPTALTLSKYKNTVARLLGFRHIDAVLDVGCGDGHFLAAFQQYGIKTYGTEYDSSMAKVAASKGIIMLTGGLQPKVPDGIKHFDLIVFREVIEHINNPALVAAYFYSLLDHGGLLFITTPNFHSIESALLGPDWGMIMYPEHLCYYTPKTLHTLLEGAGFKRITLATTNVSFFRLAEYWLKKNGSKDSPPNPEAISVAAQSAFHSNILLRTLKYLANKILAATGTGSSLVAVYRKPSFKE